MSKRKYIHFLNDILASSEKIISLIKNKSANDFARDWIRVDAMIRNLEIIGEAVKHLPEEVKEKHNQVEWKKISGLRDILIHEYFGVNYNILWDISKNKIPGLKRQIQIIIQDMQIENYG